MNDQRERELARAIDNLNLDRKSRDYIETMANELLDNFSDDIDIESYDGEGVTLSWAHHEVKVFVFDSHVGVQIGGESPEGWDRHRLNRAIAFLEDELRTLKGPSVAAAPFAPFRH